MLFDNVHHLPLRLFGLEDIPAVPIQLEEMADTLVKLGIRSRQTRQAKQGLTNTYTLGGVTATGYEFVFGRAAGIDDLADAAREQLRQSLLLEPARVLTSLFDRAFHDRPALAATAADPLTSLPLDHPEQYAMGWTVFPPVYQEALPLLPAWAASLTDPDAADAQFWPTFAEYGLALNLLILKKVGPGDLAALRATFQAAWTGALDAAAAAGLLYAIDLSLFESLEPQVVQGAVRFTPATVTLLTQDPATKALTPVAVRVSGASGAGSQVFSRATATAPAWIYALQAAKVSITVYGIWLGHVYHWHIVTAAMQMAFYNSIPDAHPLSVFLGPRSRYLIPFDDALIVLWQNIAPPTSITSACQFLRLCNQFAKGRRFFDDDPGETLARMGIREADFTRDTPWDCYPIVGQLLKVWDVSAAYARGFVDQFYPSDQAVASDAALQAWHANAADADEGNVRGLPPFRTRDALASVLASLVYRVTAHGAARLNGVANPAMSFVANFPPCLQDAAIPAPQDDFDTRQLLSFLPRTGTIGGMISFLFTFAFSTPYVSLIPLEGIAAGLPFPGGPDDPRNRPEVEFRHRILEIIENFRGWTPQRYQWPLNIET